MLFRSQGASRTSTGATGCTYLEACLVKAKEGSGREGTHQNDHDWETGSDTTCGGDYLGEFAPSSSEDESPRERRTVARYGLRGARVGEASNPGPPRAFDPRTSNPKRLGVVKDRSKSQTRQANSVARGPQHNSRASGSSGSGVRSDPVQIRAGGLGTSG